MKDVVILGIETSCDETACSVVVNGRKILSNIISSQIDIHKIYGGVVPEIASRKHIDNISYVVDEALRVANKTMEDIDAIAVTYGPGLEGALIVGVSYAKALAYAYNKKLIGVHHIEGHICANYLENETVKPPFVCLVVSGGHTHIVHVKDYGEYDILGKTRDDAVGEAYDKVARVIGLSYPGGPKIDELSKSGVDNLDFPRIMLGNDSLDFSFSGLKSAVLNYINKCKMQNIEYVQADVARSFQEAVVDVLVTKSIKATKNLGLDTLILAGGVACNSGLRERLEYECKANNINVHFPRPVLCTDNAAMIASCGYYEYINGKSDNLNLNAKSNLVLGIK